MNLSVNSLRQFHHIIEDKPLNCISGHKVKHFTYLFDTVERKIVKIGTSYCKKHGLLKQAIKNEILITGLRELIGFEQNKQNLSTPILESTKILIEKKIHYFQNLELTNDSIKYYDYKLPLEHIKQDILELGIVYFPENIENYKLLVERITDLLEITEIVELKIPIEDSDIQNTTPKVLTYSDDESSEINITLTNIRDDILRLLDYQNITNNEKINNNTESEGCVLDNIIDMGFYSGENHEKEIEKNIEIEESIKKEFEEIIKKENQEYSERIEEFEKSEEKYIEATISDYYKDLEEPEINKAIIQDIINEVTDEIEKQENNVNELNCIYFNKIQSVKYNCNELFERLRKLRENIAEYKIEFAVFQNNLAHLKSDIKRQNEKNYSFFIKHNIPWPDPIPIPTAFL